MAVLVVGAAVIASSDTTTGGEVTVAQLACVRGTTTEPPLRTLNVTFTGEGETFVVAAHPDGDFEITDVPPGLPGDMGVRGKWYRPSSDVQIGSATSAGRMTVELSSGLNAVSIPL